MKCVDFFLVGAAKSGTTSMARYLSEHPGICFANPKEPQFFSSDFRTGSSGIKSLDEYHKRYFSHCREAPLLRGEGSVLYLPSQVAVPRILEYNSKAKFIVMLRNPLPMAESWHADLVIGGHENLRDFDKAWELQEARKKGRKLPFSCMEPKFLQYKELCSLGEQLQNLLAFVNSQNVHIIFFDDFVENVEKEYVKTLDFLGLNYEVPQGFPKENAKKRWEKPWMYKMSQVTTWLVRLRRSLGFSKGFGLSYYMNKLLVPAKKSPKVALSPAMKRKMAKAFRQDIDLLSFLTKRDLSSWYHVS